MYITVLVFIVFKNINNDQSWIYSEANKVYGSGALAYMNLFPDPEINFVFFVKRFSKTV